MRSVILSCLVVLLAGLAPATVAREQGEGKPSAIPQTPEWQKLKSLVGEWQGFVDALGRFRSRGLQVHPQEVTGGPPNGPPWASHPRRRQAEWTKRFA